jgi:asparagine synthase (glutamine-hydrolysing)
MNQVHRTVYPFVPFRLTRPDIADRTAKHLGVEMFTKDMDEAEFAKSFEDCTWHNEHHIFDFGTVGKFALSELPRQHGFKVILSGEGSDEIFAGYPWFVPEFLLEPDLSQPELVLQKDDNLRKRLQERSVNELLVSFNSFLPPSNESPADPALDKQLNHIMGPGIFSTRIMYNEMLVKSIGDKYSSSDKLRRVIENISPSALKKIQTKWHPLHTSMYAWCKNNLPNYLLTALGDRCEMAHSIEGRPPFLDHHLVELLGNIPPSLKMHYGSDVAGPDSRRSQYWSKGTDAASGKFWEKWILREAAKPFITEELYLRRKHPYSAPITFPAGGALHELFERLLTKENVDAVGFLDWSTIQEYYRAAFSDARDTAALRRCITAASFVTLSKRFGVATAQV